MTLPRLLPAHLRVFATKREYKTKISAHRHAAFMAYKALYDAGLLNDSLLPLTSMNPIEERMGTARVALQMNPWRPANDEDLLQWWCYELAVEGMEPMQMFLRCQPPAWRENEEPILYRPGQLPAKFAIRLLGEIGADDEILNEAKEYTRRIFWSINGTRMKWDNTEFTYLFLPGPDVDDSEWEARRMWLAQENGGDYRPTADAFSAPAEDFGDEFEYPDDLMIVRTGFSFGKAYRFVGWRFEELDVEEEEQLRERYERFDDDPEIRYPLLEVERFPPRTNFLVPIPPKAEREQDDGPKTLCLLPCFSMVTLLSSYDLNYSLLLPSILRAIALSITVTSFQSTLLVNTPLQNTPLSLLQTALTSPASQERPNYQRLETLGDTVLKLLAGLQLLAQYPYWHEGYLTRQREHAVSNVRLAKDAVERGLSKWIIRDRLLGKKWKPQYFGAEDVEDVPLEPNLENENVTLPAPPPKLGKGQKPKKKQLSKYELSTKGVLYLIPRSR